MDSKKVIEKLKSGFRIYGTSITSNSPLWADVVKNAKLDFVFFDTEHIPLGRETLSQMCKIYSALNILPIVRIPSPNPYEACTMLDGGAQAILVPYIENVQQVKQLVGAVKFRPIKGEKLIKILNDEIILNSKLKNYVDDRCKNNLLFINIESEPAVNNIESILNVQGIDGVIIGPHDLSCSLGIPEEYNNPFFDLNVKKIITECNKRNIAIGIHLSENPEHQIKWAQAGVNIILHSSDITLFAKKINSDFTKIKNSLNDSSDSISESSIII